METIKSDWEAWGITSWEMEEDHELRTAVNRVLMSIRRNERRLPMEERITRELMKRAGVTEWAWRGTDFIGSLYPDIKAQDRARFRHEYAVYRYQYMGDVSPAYAGWLIHEMLRILRANAWIVTPEKGTIPCWYMLGDYVSDMHQLGASDDDNHFVWSLSKRAIELYLGEQNDDL